jgi:hypothetical protein
VAPLRLGGLRGKQSTPSIGWEVPVRSRRSASGSGTEHANDVYIHCYLDLLCLTSLDIPVFPHLCLRFFLLMDFRLALVTRLASNQPSLALIVSSSSEPL